MIQAFTDGTAWIMFSSGGVIEKLFYDAQQGLLLAL